MIRISKLTPALAAAAIGVLAIGAGRRGRPAGAAGPQPAASGLLHLQAARRRHDLHGRPSTRRRSRSRSRSWCAAPAPTRS